MSATNTSETRIKTVAGSWAWMLFRGILGVVAGIVMIVYPVVALQVAVILVSWFLIFNGIFVMGLSTTTSRRSRQALLVFEGIVNIALGALAILWPGITLLSLVGLIAFWAVFTGAVQVWAGIQFRREVRSSAWLTVLGILTLAFGVFVLFYPITGYAFLVGIMAAYALAQGVINLAAAYSQRQEVKSPQPQLRPRGAT